MMKKLMPKREASIEEIENFLLTMQQQVENFNDDRIKSEFENLIADIAKENDICPCCFTHVEEAWTSEGLYQTCNCRTKKLSA